uniref:NADH dehydrogenase subunit 6 n=1 Tax=Panagrolaimus davidi TaxID=227884 RepID=A0A914QTA8_9BILA
MSTTSEAGPITQFLRRTFHDPATNKLLSTGLKIYLIFSAIHHIRSERILIPAYVVYGTSLQSTMAMTLALMNLSGFVFAADSYRTLLMMQKYLLIAVAIHSFLALLSFSLIYGRFTVVEEKWFFVDGVKEAPQHYYPNMISKHIGPVITTTDDPLNSTLPHYSHKVYYEKYAHAVIDLPYAFALTVFAFVISFIRILPAAMPSKPNTNNEIVVPDSFEQMPTDNSDKKFNNLPTVIEFLQNPNENKKHLPF